jgi:hypothetical protein
MYEVDERLSVESQQRSLIVTEDIEERKSILIGEADVIVALPGGVGTFEELYEAAAVGKPIILVNYDGFYDSMLAQHQAFNLAMTAETVEEVLQKLETHPLAQPTLFDKYSDVIPTPDAEQFFLVPDMNGTFLAVMKKNHYQYVDEKTKPKDIQSLFDLSCGIIVLPVDSPYTFAAVHKMITYNKLGLHGRIEGQPIHKPMVLLDENNSGFFNATTNQLKRACSENLLGTSCMRDIFDLNDINEATRLIHEKTQANHVALHQHSIWASECGKSVLEEIQHTAGLKL